MRKIFLLLFLVVTVYSYGHNAAADTTALFKLIRFKLDSVHEELKTEKNDSVIAIAEYWLGDLYWNASNDSCLPYLRKTIERFKDNSKNRKYAYDCAYKIAEHYLEIHQDDSTLKYARIMRKLSAIDKNYPFYFESKYIENEVYIESYRYEKAQTILSEALNEADSLKLENERNDVLYRISEMYMIKKDTVKAEEYTKRLIPHYVKAKRYRKAARLFLRLSQLNSHKDLPMALKYSDSIIHYSGNYGDGFLTKSAAYAHQITLYLRQNKLEQAQIASDSAIKNMNRVKSVDLNIVVNLNRSKLYLALNNNAKALAVLDSIEPFINKYGDTQHFVGLYKNKASAHEKLGDFERALYYQKLILKKELKINSKSFQASLGAMEAQFRNKEKEAKILEQQHELDLKEQKLSFNKKVTWMSVFGGIILLGIGYFVYNRHQAEQKLKLNFQLLELKHKALQLQLNPHFIFNAMATINAVINKNELDIAKQSLQQLSNLMRGILFSSREEDIVISDELKTIKSFLELNKLIGLSEFDYQIQLNDIDPEEYAIPPMIIQPIIENALKHGITPGKEKGLIKLEFQKTNDIILITIEDNGVGRNSELKTTLAGNSVSTSIIKERLISLLGEENKPYEITDLKNPSGTIVRMKVPVVKAWD